MVLLLLLLNHRYLGSWLFILQLVGSTPEFPSGIMDNIEKIAEVSRIQTRLPETFIT